MRRRPSPGPPGRAAWPARGRSSAPWRSSSRDVDDVDVGGEGCVGRPAGQPDRPDVEHAAAHRRHRFAGRHSRHHGDRARGTEEPAQRPRALDEQLRAIGDDHDVTVRRRAGPAPRRAASASSAATTVASSPDAACGSHRHHSHRAVSAVTTTRHQSAGPAHVASCTISARTTDVGVLAANGERGAGSEVGGDRHVVEPLGGAHDRRQLGGQVVGVEADVPLDRSSTERHAEGVAVLAAARPHAGAERRRCGDGVDDARRRGDMVPQAGRPLLGDSGGEGGHVLRLSRPVPGGPLAPRRCARRATSRRAATAPTSPNTRNSGDPMTTATTIDPAALKAAARRPTAPAVRACAVAPGTGIGDRVPPRQRAWRAVDRPPPRGRRSSPRSPPAARGSPGAARRSRLEPSVIVAPPASGVAASTGSPSTRHGTRPVSWAALDGSMGVDVDEQVVRLDRRVVDRHGRGRRPPDDVPAGGQGRRRAPDAGPASQTSAATGGASGAAEPGGVQPAPPHDAGLGERLAAGDLPAVELQRCRRARDRGRRRGRRGGRREIVPRGRLAVRRDPRSPGWGRTQWPCPQWVRPVTGRGNRVRSHSTEFLPGGHR